MRICLPIVALVIAICLRFGSLVPPEGSPRLELPPLPPELLARVYGASAAGGDAGDQKDADGDSCDHDDAFENLADPVFVSARLSSKEMCNFSPAGFCPSSEPR